MIQNEAAVEVSFEPSLWKQRREWANSNITTQTVLDIGCGEGVLLEILVNDTKFSHIGGLDIDLDCLYQAVHYVKPNQRDFDFMREKPLELDLYHGSLVNYDERLAQYQTIVMLEVIEHLEKPVLDQLPKIVFGRYRPLQVLISTPNAEFNVFFKDLNGFRHWDHKFEWTRAEFQNWCNQIANYYGYSVVFGGVGLLGKYENNIGFCSQTAVFQLLPSSPTTAMDHYDGISEGVELLKHIDYPYFTQHFTRKEMLNEIIDNLEYLNLGQGKSLYGILKISDLWNILRIRQVCKDYHVLIECLQSNSEKFVVHGDEFKMLFRVISKDLEFFSDLNLGKAEEDDSWGNFEALAQDPW